MYLSKCLFLFSRQTLGFSVSLGFYLNTTEPHFSFLSLIVSSITLTPALKAMFLLTSVHYLRIRNLNALAYLPKKYYLCVEMAGKGLISRMSDECLMKGKSGISYFDEYQAGTRKFTLAGKTFTNTNRTDWTDEILFQIKSNNMLYLLSR